MWRGGESLAIPALHNGRGARWPVTFNTHNEIQAASDKLWNDEQPSRMMMDQSGWALRCRPSDRRPEKNKDPTPWMR